MTAQALRAALLRWHRDQRRPLPWRSTRDPYAVLVSEVMLQQTQAARVAPAWRVFVRRFPTVGALAAARTGDVVSAWQGLGYNRRAVNLQRAARIVVDAHGGRVPEDLDALRALPGVGDYTARAVLTFAFGHDAAPVDTNVARVLARAFAGRPLRRADAQALADRLIPAGAAAEWSGALMDFGATVCTARSPRCGHCPVADSCAWRRRDAVPDPAAAGGLRPRPQGAFVGSERYHRGLLVDALRRGRVPIEALPAAAGLADPVRARRVADALVADGLARWLKGELALPEV